MKSVRDEKKEKLELAQPDEKLLRAPSFSEKYGVVKPIILVVILIITLYLGVNYLQQKENNANDFKPRTGEKILNRQGSVNDRIPVQQRVRWRTYASAIGKYSIKYPHDYSLVLLKESQDNIQITSPVIKEINSDFRFSIRFEPVTGNQTLQELINKNPICDTILYLDSMPSTINGESQAKLFTDTPCGQTSQSIVYTLNNNILYIITIDSDAKFSDVKPFADKLFSNLKFLDRYEKNAATCKPRPACLDSTPRCMIPETPDMCPKNTTPEVSMCAQDARQCPDGSWVGRTGPNCEFSVCPNKPAIAY